VQVISPQPHGVQNGDILDTLNGVPFRPTSAPEAAQQLNAAREQGNVHLGILRGACQPLPPTVEECAEAELPWYRGRCYSSLSSQLLTAARAEQDSLDAETREKNCHGRRRNALTSRWCSDNPLCEQGLFTGPCVPKPCHKISLPLCPAYCAKVPGVWGEKCADKADARKKSYNAADCQVADGIWDGNACT
jgi:hypothetical protein